MLDFNVDWKPSIFHLKSFFCISFIPDWPALFSRGQQPILAIKVFKQTRGLISMKMYTKLSENVSAFVRLSNYNWQEQ